MKKAVMKMTGKFSDDESVSTLGASAAQEPKVAPIVYKYKSYRELPAESIKLDAELFPLLQQVVAGTKSTLLVHVNRPSYVQGMLILYKHIEISASERMMEAFRRMDRIKFSGDVHDYQVECVSAVQEMYDSNCTIEGYIMSRIMKSFKGTAKTVQMEIARDLNSNRITRINVYDLIEKYCSQL